MTSDPKAMIAAKFLDSFLREIVLDTALTTHASIKRARSICHLCGTRCQAHAPAAQQSSISSSLDSTTPTSRSGTPVPGAASASTKPDYYSNNPLFECLVCSRQVSSNRYATHLAKCMGMGSKGGRKGAARNAKATPSSSLAGRSGAGTPRYSSDLDDDSFAKRKNGVNAKNGAKRANSPLSASTLANARMTKRIKTSSPTPPPADSLGTTTGMNRSYSAQTFAPSGLSTVVIGSPLNPNNASSSSSTSGKPPSTSKSNGASSKLKHDAGKKRKRLLDDDDDDEAGASYDDASASEDDSNEEEGEISDDDDIALASRPKSSSTKIKIPLRGTPTSSKPKTFTIADDSDDDSDTQLSQRRKSSHQPSDDDDDDDDEDEDDDDDDDDDDDGDDVQVTRVSHGTTNGGAKPKKPSAIGSGGGLQRERGSDGEFIDVESASEQSDADSF